MDFTLSWNDVIGCKDNNLIFWHFFGIRCPATFLFFPPNTRAGIRAAKKNSTFSALMVCFLFMNFLDVHKGIKWYGIRLDRGSLLQVGRPLPLVEIAHDVVVLQWRNWGFLSLRNKSSTSSRFAITKCDLIALNKIFQFILVLSTGMNFKCLDK